MSDICVFQLAIFNNRKGKNMEIWKYENMEIWKYGNMEIWIYGNMEI